MMQSFLASDPKLKALLRQRGGTTDDGVAKIVENIIQDVSARGDAALLENARRFDAPRLSSLHLTAEEIETATVPPDLEEAIRVSFSRVRDFHQRQLDALFGSWGEGRSWSQDGVGQRALVLERAGVYVPGGRAVYPSSVIMNAGPAVVAGVPNVTISTPAQPDGTLHPAVLVAMRTVGVQSAIKVGGAAAIAATALGTESIQRVDKIVGPGNKFVNEAKRQLWGRCGFDGFAAASEVCVLVDEEADAKFAALDLLTQIEHAPDNVGFLVSTSESKLREVHSEAAKLIPSAKDPVGIQVALEGSYSILGRDINECIEIINEIAPEHLSLSISKPEEVVARIQTAGCVLMGEWTPESAGDYIFGPSHTLPTGGAGRWQSPVNVMDFIKFQSISYMNQETLQPLIPHIDALASAEGFKLHAQGATARRVDTDHLGEVRGC